MKLGGGVRNIEHDQEEIRVDRLLQGRPERRHQVVRQVAHEACDGAVRLEAQILDAIGMLTRVSDPHLGVFDVILAGMALSRRQPDVMELACDIQSFRDRRAAMERSAR